MSDIPVLCLLQKPTIKTSEQTDIPIKIGLPSLLLIYLATCQKEGWVSRSTISSDLNEDGSIDEIDLESGAFGSKNIRVKITRAKEITMQLEETYQLQIDDVSGDLRWNITSDVAMFQEHYKRGQYFEALNLYQNHLLKGNKYLGKFPYFRELQEELRSNCRNALYQALQDLEQKQRYESALDILQKLDVVDVWDEEIVACAMKLYYYAGQQKKSLQGYDKLVKEFKTEGFGEPSLELQQLKETIQNNSLKPLGDKVIIRNIPLENNQLVNRFAEVSMIDHHLQDPSIRLITLLGIGGVGKTRLALRVATKYSETDKFPDGICFLSLLDINQEEDFYLQLAKSLDITLLEQLDVRRQIIDSLSTKSLLLLLDNLESAPYTLDFIEDLMRLAPDIKVITTSRQALSSGSGGRLFAYEQQIPIDGLEDNYSLQLFSERTGHENYSEDEINTIQSMCEFVDHLPLAIELLASLAKKQPLEQLKALLELEKTELFLKETEKHHHIHRVFDLSFEQLDQQQQISYLKLVPFSGSFDQKAARKAQSISLEDLQHFVTASLLVRERSGRFSIHPVLHDLAKHYFEQHQSGDLKDAFYKHASYYCSWLKQAHSKEAYVELANLQNAWKYFLDDPASNLDYFAQGQIAERLEQWQIAKDLYKRSGEQANQDSLEKAESLFAFANLHYRDSLEDAYEHLDIVQSIVKAQDTAQTKALLLKTMMVMGRIRLLQGHRGKANDLLDSAHKLSQDLSDRLSEIKISHSLVRFEAESGHYDQALQLLMNSEALCYENDYQTELAKLLTNKAIILQRLDKLDEAKNALEQSNQVYLSIGDKYNQYGLAKNLGELGRLSEKQGDYEAAYRFYSKALENFKYFGDVVTIVTALDNRASCAIKLQELNHAVEDIKTCTTLMQHQDLPARQLDTLATIALIAAEKNVEFQDIVYFVNSNQKTEVDSKDKIIHLEEIKVEFPQNITVSQFLEKSLLRII